MTPASDPLLLVVSLAGAVVVAVLGLSVWNTARRSPHRAVELARRLFPSLAVRSPGLLEGPVLGRVVSVTAEAQTLRITTELPPPPLAYIVAARALGRGDLLAAFVRLRVSWLPHGLAVEIAPPFPATAVRARIEETVRFADQLAALSMPDAMARWALDESTASDRLEALQRLIAAFPDHPETHQVCLLLADEHMDDEAATLARSHLRAMNARRAEGPA